MSLSAPEQQPDAPQSPSSPARFARGVWDLLQSVVPAVIIALLIHLFLAQATRVYGQSMEPTLLSNQRVVVEKVSYRFGNPDRGDVIVVQVPGSADELLIKRVIGLPGEKVSIRDGQVWINGAPLAEPYLPATPTPGHVESVTVPLLHVYVLGDNRSASNDSRSFGTIHRDQILGKAWFTYWPLEQIGLVQ